jgi:hypothetical protein
VEAEICSRVLVITGKVTVNGVQRSCVVSENHIRSGFQVRGALVGVGCPDPNIPMYGKIQCFFWVELVRDMVHNETFLDARHGRGQLFAKLKLYGRAPDVYGLPAVRKHLISSRYIIPASRLGDMVVFVRHPRFFEDGLHLSSDVRQSRHNTLCVLRCPQKKYIVV